MLFADAGDSDNAGIGSDSGRSPGNITILGGEVIARSGYKSSFWSGKKGGGAGIGGGNDCGAGGDIVIKGGRVRAEGTFGGAGIGIGRSDEGCRITITGGTVDASGHYGGDVPGYWSSGINCGIGDITITGGTVTARGDPAEAPGNGPGITGKYITITGGTVTAIGGKNGAGIGHNWKREGGTLSSGTNGSAWVIASSVGADRTKFTSGVLIDGSKGIVYGDPTIKENAAITSGKTLKIDSGQTLTVAHGTTLTVAKGATLTVESGGHLVNNGSIVNNGRVRLPAGSSIPGMAGSGVTEIDGKAEPKKPTEDEKKAAKKIIDKIIKRASGAASGLRAADEDAMEAEVKLGDILFDTVNVEGSLCTMSINVKAEPNQYAIIANGQMVDVAHGSDTNDNMDNDEDANGVDDTPKGKIVYVDRFVAPKSSTKTSDIELDEVSVEDAGVTELDATIVVVNGRASEEVQTMSEYTPSGLVDGRGLAVFWDDEFKMNVLVVFDGDETDGNATDIIYAKEDAGETPQKRSSGGSGCDAGLGIAALLALGILGIMKRR